jgi:hypothetical protein
MMHRAEFACAVVVLTSLAGLATTAAAEESIEKSVQRGPVEVILRVDPAEPVIGDPIHLEIIALADEGVELLMPEFGEALDRFLILDFAPSEGLAEDGRTRSVQRYTLQPPMSGPQSIPILLVEFVDRRPGSKPAPEGEDAYELLTERIDFEVESVLPEEATGELRPMPGKLSAIGGPDLPYWLIGLILLGSIALASPFAYRAWLRHQALRRRQTAYEVASKELDELLIWGSHPREDQLEKFYVELSGIVRRYLERRFNLRSPELTTQEFLKVASRSPDLRPEMRGLLKDFLTQADLVKFAGFHPGQEQVQESILAARRFLEETRETAESPGTDRVPGASGAKGSVE